MARSLLLNASFEPLCVVSSRRAVVLVLKEKAEIVHRNGAEMRSERRSIPVPTVIRLVHVEGLTLVDAGARMGRSADAARKLYGRALAAMAERLRGAKDTAS